MTQIHRKQQNGKTCSSEVGEQAIRLVIDHHDSYCSQWEAITSITAKIGCTAETLRAWVGQQELRSRPTTRFEQ